jgi:hypothetical protein
MKVRASLSLLKLIATLLLAVVLSHPMRAMAEASADRQFSAISRLIEKADRTLEDNNWQDAARLYGATIAAYRDFSERFPDYETDLVKFRVSYCRQQLMNMLAQKRARERAAATDSTPPPDKQIIEMCTRLCKEGRFEEAQTEMDSLQDASRQSTPVLLLQATINVGLGELKQARTIIETILEGDGENGIAHYNLVQLMLRDPAPDYESARQHYREARRLGIPPDSDLEVVLDL